MTAPDEAAALAAQIQEQIQDLRGQLACVQAAVTRLAGDSTGPMMTVLLEVKRLRERLDDAIAKRAAADPPAPYLLGLSREEHAARVAEVRAWVERVGLGQYPGYFASLPPCWAAHPDAVIELSTLMTEWARIYGDPASRPLHDALWWHERWLPGCLSRLAQAITCDVAGCRLARSSPWQRSPPRST
jgi:hypothetical protein